MMLRFLLLTVLSAAAWTIATVCCVEHNHAFRTPVNLLSYPMLKDWNVPIVKEEVKSYPLL